LYCKPLRLFICIMRVCHMLLKDLLTYLLTCWTTFVLTIYHYIGLSLQTENSSLSQILSSIVFLVPCGLPSRIITCTELSGHWRFSFFLYLKFFWLRVLYLADHTELMSPRDIVVSYREWAVIWWMVVDSTWRRSYNRTSTTWLHSWQRSEAHVTRTKTRNNSSSGHCAVT